MTEEDGQSEIDKSKREASEEFNELEDKGDEMEERLEEHESAGEDVEVPEPGKGEDLSISTQEDNEAAGLGEEAGLSEDAVPDDEGEAAGGAGQ